jgi:FkbM family methyltransferase
MNSLSKSLVYGAVEVLTAGRGVPRVINGEPVRFPARWSRFYPSSYEPDRHRFLRSHCRAGQTVLDIGAHIGLYSTIFATLVGSTGKVFAFEPTPATRGVLERTIRLNHCERIVEVRPEAVSNLSGHTSFFDTGIMGSNSNSLVRDGRSRGEYAVQVVKVDDFAAARGLAVDCLKIDVEGAELNVIEGASRTLESQRPVLALELHPAVLLQGGASLMSIWSILREHHYVVFSGSTLVDETWFIGQSAAFEIQALPRERSA